jgi:hypothetical protein
MSITQNFENRRVYPSILDPDKTCYGYQDVSELLDHTRKIEALVKKYEKNLVHIIEIQDLIKLSQLLTGFE